MSTPEISSATSAGFATNPAFRALLTDASDATGEELDALLQGISSMELLVVLDPVGNPQALAVYHRLDTYAVEIEYLAVAPVLRRRGVAQALVNRVQELESAMVVARTDDDAIEFYRNSGFQCSDSAADPRWPRNHRFICVLPYLPLVSRPETDSSSVEWVNGSPEPMHIAVVEPLESWTRDFATLAGAITAALGTKALAIEHLGSTSVPGLGAKPVIDVVLTVEDPAAEDDYVRDLATAGFTLRLREPRWYAHRLLIASEGSGHPTLNLHVFAPGCPETSRMRTYRDWLRRHPADRNEYARIKNAAAAQLNERGGGLVMDYNAAKEPFIRDLYAKIYAD